MLPLPYTKKLVVSTPLSELWNDSGPVPGTCVRHRDLDTTAIKALLRDGPLQFVVANPGDKLRWIDAQGIFKFWKSELIPHLYDPKKLHLDDYPDAYFYLASEWRLDSGEAVILLEICH